MSELVQQIKQYPIKLIRKIPIDRGNYPYVCARLRAKKSLLYPPEMYQKFLQMEISQISRTIGEGQYKDEILALGVKHSGVDLIEMATSENLAQTYTKILDFSEGHLKDIISKFIDRWDVFNLQTIMRGLFYGADCQEIWEDIVAAGSLSEDFLRQLTEKESVDEVIEALEGTIYYEPLIEARETYGGDACIYGEECTVAHYEDVLHCSYYFNLLETVQESNIPNKLFLQFIKMEIDMINLRTLLRLTLGEAEIAKPNFIEGGLEMSLEDLEGLVELDWDDLLVRLDKYPFYETIKNDLVQAKIKGLNEVMRILEKHILREASRYANLHPLSILPVLDFMIAKRKEVDNLRIIARGKASELDNEVIRNLLVI